MFDESIRWHITLVHPVTHDVHFDRSIMVVYTKLFYCKVTLVSPFIINAYFGGYIETAYYFSLDFQFIHLCIYINMESWFSVLFSAS